jgi:RNase H-fold protein (predicted Holliday junction resolvase)
MKRDTNIVGIDRGSKYIGLAYMSLENRIPMPIGYILNDHMTMPALADVVARYRAQGIVVGYPQRQKDVQDKIQAFVKSLTYVISSDVAIEYIDEDYSSVQAGEMISDFKKNAASDTVSAMLILDRWDAENKD